MKTTFLVALSVLALSLPALAEPAAVTPTTGELSTSMPINRPGRFGLGLGASSLVNGITGKLFLTNTLSAQAIIGYWYGGLALGVDGLYEFPVLWQNKDVALNWNVGAGVGVGFFSYGPYSSTNFGFSGIGGLILQLRTIPLEFSAELRPTFLTGNYYDGFHFGAGGAVRYYF